jgi:CrcB protein
MLNVNLAVCFLKVLFWAIGDRYSWNENMQLLLMNGICGGFTTFYTFSLESIFLIQNHKYIFFTVYIISSVVLGLLATFAGYKLMSNF